MQATNLIMSMQRQVSKKPNLTSFLQFACDEIGIFCQVSSPITPNVRFRERCACAHPRTRNSVFRFVDKVTNSKLKIKSKINKLKLKDSESKQTNKQENYFIWEKKITPKTSEKKPKRKWRSAR